jgi:hypothetical protein
LVHGIIISSVFLIRICIVITSDPLGKSDTDLLEPGVSSGFDPAVQCATAPSSLDLSWNGGTRFCRFGMMGRTQLCCAANGLSLFMGNGKNHASRF